MRSLNIATMRSDLFRRSRLLAAGAGLVALSALTAGCASTGTSDVNPADYDFRLRHPVLISDEPETFDLHVGMRGPALSPEIETALRDYVSEYRREGTGGVTIQVPVGSANEVAAASTGRAVHYALVRAGVPHQAISVAPYQVDDRSEIAPLRVSYLRVKAVVPRCGVWPAGTDGDYRNADYYNLGCAQTANLAAMVENPADMVRPRAAAPASGVRRAMVIKAFGEGADPKSKTTLIQSDLGG